MPKCSHDDLCFEPSSHAKEAGYKKLTIRQLQQVESLSSLKKAATKTKLQGHKPSTFPAPLVLPGDELSWDPQYEPQSFQNWIDEPHRNAVTDQRRTLYVVSSPEYPSDMPSVQQWAKPKLKRANKSPEIPLPSTTHVVENLQAFYYGLPVKVLEKPRLKFMPWEDVQPKSKKKSFPAFVGLNIGSEAIGIRVRPSKDGIFSGQLNLNDLLDAAIAILPEDAYALLMLMEHDLYEDEEDDFCCGRAYGGSRVAVVSMARYHPALDDTQAVEREHAWPASHCRAYMDDRCREEGASAAKKPKRNSTFSTDHTSALGSATTSFAALLPPKSPKDLSVLWLGRLCRTASHELGHCFGMDHCVHYACSMQGTAGLTEDARQPPYLCPVDLAKVLYATGAGPMERYRAMLSFCEQFSSDRLFKAFAAWLQVRMQELKGPE